MLRYFYRLGIKLAGDNAATIRENLSQPLRTFAMSMGAPLAAMGTGMGAMALARSVDKPLTPQQIEELRGVLHASPHLNLSGPLKGVGPAFHPAAYTVHLMDHPGLATTAHEFGHASGKSLLNHTIAGPSVVANRYLSMLSSALLPWFDPTSTTSKVLTVAPALMSAPSLVEEARASLRGLRAIKQLHGMPAAARALGILAPAFGSYVLSAASPFIARKLLYPSS